MRIILSLSVVPLPRGRFEERENEQTTNIVMMMLLDDNDEEELVKSGKLNLEAKALEK